MYGVEVDTSPFKIIMNFTLYKLIGSKSTFAIEIEISTGLPYLGGKTRLWINSEPIGIYDEMNMLGPFRTGLEYLLKHHDRLWEPELFGLNCVDTFLTARPFFKDPDAIYDMSYEEVEPYIKFDKFDRHFGENFDSWSVCIVIHDAQCNFLWYKHIWDNGKPQEDCRR